MTHVFKDLSGSKVMKEWRESRSRAAPSKAFAVTRADASHQALGGGYAGQMSSRSITRTR